MPNIPNTGPTPITSTTPQEDITALREELKLLQEDIYTTGRIQARAISEEHAGINERFRLSTQKAKLESDIARGQVKNLDAAKARVSGFDEAIRRLTATINEATAVSQAAGRRQHESEDEAQELRAKISSLTSKETAKQEEAAEMAKKRLPMGDSAWAYAQRFGYEELTSHAQKAGEMFGPLGKGLAQKAIESGVLGGATTAVFTAFASIAAAASLLNKLFTMAGEQVFKHTSSLTNAMGAAGGSYYKLGRSLDVEFSRHAVFGYKREEYQAQMEAALKSGFLSSTQMGAMLGASPASAGGTAEAAYGRITPAIAELGDTFLRLGRSLGLSAEESGRLLASTTTSLAMVTRWNMGIEHTSQQVYQNTALLRGLGTEFGLSTTEAFKYMEGLRGINVVYGESFDKTAKLALGIREIFDVERGTGLRSGAFKDYLESTKNYAAVTRNLFSGANISATQFVGYQSMLGRLKGPEDFNNALYKAFSATPLQRAGAALQTALKVAPGERNRGMFAMTLQSMGFNDMAIQSLVNLKYGSLKRLGDLLSTGSLEGLDTKAMAEKLKAAKIDVEAGDLQSAMQDPLGKIVDQLKQMLDVLVGTTGAAPINQAAKVLIRASNPFGSRERSIATPTEQRSRPAIPRTGMAPGVFIPRGSR